MLRSLPKLLVPLVAASLALFAVPAVAQDDPCVTTSSGATACGHVTIVGCGVASASGVATASVHWKFVVWTTSSLYGYHATTHEADGTTYTHTTTDWCATDTCTFGALYADGVLVHQPLGVC